MAGIPPVALLLGAAAAFMLLGGKKGGEKGEPTDDSAPSLDGDGKPSGGVPEIPKAKTQDELKKELEEEAAASLKEVRDGLQWKLMPAGYDIPNGMAHNDLWVSEDCEAAAIGRDWKPVKELGGKLYDPASAWKEFGQGERPNKGLGANKGTSAVTWYALEMMKWHHKELLCPGEFPDPGDYDNQEDYGNAWTDLRNAYPAMGEVFDEVYRRIGEPMMGAWFEADQGAWMDYQIERAAKYAVSHYPSEDLTEQTDQAYLAFSGQFGELWDEGPPPVLDPDNPAHESWVTLWVDLNQAIKDL